MDVEILHWQDDIRKSRIGFVDFKVTYDEYKWEIFRGVGVFKKGDKLWINLGAVPRGDKWVQRFERSTGFKEMFEAVIHELHKRYVEK